MGSKKATVCVHVFPSLDFVEIIQLEPTEGAIEKATSLPAAFDQTTRLIEDSDQMGRVIKDLYDANRISLNTPTVLVLPSYFTREIDLPPDFSDDELRLTLTSEAERFYIFKKNDPHVDWLKLNETTLLYSAFPKIEIERYARIFQNNRIPLVGIELNYFSILRGLVATGAIADEIASNTKWCLLVVSDFAFFGAVLCGEKIEKTVETPLSVSATDEMSKISEIKQDFDSFLGLEMLNKMILVNNATQLSSDGLIRSLNFQEQVIIIEQNGSTLRSRGELNGIYPCTLEAIGGALRWQFPDLPAMNFIPESAEQMAALQGTRDVLQKFLMIGNGIAVVLCLLLWGVFSLLLWGKTMDNQQLHQSLSSIKSSQGNEVYRKIFIKQDVDQNVKANNLIVKLGSLIPNDVWITDITLDLQSKRNSQLLEVKGGSLIPELVNQYLNDLNRELKRSDLEVAKADLATSDDGQSFYDWVIKSKDTPNTPSGQASPPMQPGMPPSGNPNPAGHP